MDGSLPGHLTSPWRARLRAASFVLLGALGAPGCRDLERFDTAGDAQYCGGLLAPGFASTGLAESGNQSTRLRLGVTLSTKTLATRPGLLESNDAGFGICAPKRLFDRAPLRTVEQALHDEISALQIGEGHEEDVLTWVDSTCSGSMLAVLSLVQDGHVEVRLFRPNPEPLADTPVTESPGFGVFSLEREDRGCGF
jgi:hypothetical protein